MKKKINAFFDWTDAPAVCVAIAVIGLLMTLAFEALYIIGLTLCLVAFSLSVVGIIKAIRADRRA